MTNSKKGNKNIDKLRKYLKTFDTTTFDGTLEELEIFVREDPEYLRDNLYRLRIPQQKFLHSKNVSQCTACLVVKGRYGFSKMGKGFRNVCSDCQKLLYDYEIEKIWYEKNKEHRKAYQRLYYEKNREKISEYNRYRYKQRKRKKILEAFSQIDS